MLRVMVHQRLVSYCHGVKLGQGLKNANDKGKSKVGEKRKLDKKVNEGYKNRFAEVAKTTLDDEDEHMRSVEDCGRSHAKYNEGQQCKKPRMKMRAHKKKPTKSRYDTR